ncbi:uncharacterized protein [Anabrus simplex]|uniref:uncharacterized protein n=1 Tax=Anabrus simplex TaxID=316456 RepID=UPI0035A39DB4
MTGYILAVLISFLLWRHSTGQVFQGTRVMSQLIQAGKDQYAILNERLKNPRYGSCWKNAISSLNDGCKDLSEHIQSDIALKFTDCFLKMSGHESYECDKLVGLLRKECMQDMSDRAFNVYTEFYTHTQNMCFYLQSHFWHEETEKTIDRLSASSAKVTMQLEQAEEIQNTIFKYQKDSMAVQQELLENGFTLREVLQESHKNLNEIMYDFKTSAEHQQRLLSEVFDRLSSLQEWAVGEISWFGSVVFYLSAVIIFYIITATPKTQQARFFIFLSLIVNAFVERVICLSIAGGNEPLGNVNEALFWWVWLCRKIFLAVCIIVLSVSIYNYRDYNVMNYSLLVQVREQNLKILSYLENPKLQNKFSETLKEKEKLLENSKIDYYHVESILDDAVSTSSDIKAPKIPVTDPAVKHSLSARQFSNLSPLSRSGTPELHNHNTSALRKEAINRSASPSPSTASTRSVSSYSVYHSSSRRRPLVDSINSRGSSHYNLRNHQSASAKSPA